MSAPVLYMSISLEGFIAGPNERLDNGLGDGGDRLHEWVIVRADADHAELGRPADIGRPASVNGQVFNEMMSTGAVVAGRGRSHDRNGSSQGGCGRQERAGPRCRNGAAGTCRRRPRRDRALRVGLPSVQTSAGR